MKRLSNVNSVKKIEVIEVRSLIGSGEEESPIEEIVEYFLLDGTRLARVTIHDNPDKIIET